MERWLSKCPTEGMPFSVTQVYRLNEESLEYSLRLQNETDQPVTIGDLAIPLMLLTLGVSLAKLRVASLGRSIALSAGRLAIGLAVGLAVAALLEMEGAARGILILESTMPVAVLNYLFAARYNRSPEEVAGLVLVSTAISFVTLPGLLLLVL